MNNYSLVTIGLVVGLIVGAGTGIYVFPDSKLDSTDQEIALKVDSLENTLSLMEDEISSLKLQIQSLDSSLSDLQVNAVGQDLMFEEFLWYHENNFSITLLLNLDETTSLLPSFDTSWYAVHYDFWIDRLNYELNYTAIEITRLDIREKAFIYKEWWEEFDEFWWAQVWFDPIWRIIIVPDFDGSIVYWCKLGD